VIRIFTYRLFRKQHFAVSGDVSNCDESYKDNCAIKLKFSKSRQFLAFPSMPTDFLPVGCVLVILFCFIYPKMLMRGTLLLPMLQSKNFINIISEHM